MNTKQALLISFCLIASFLQAQDLKLYWNIDSPNSITWKVDKQQLPHSDHIEMAGKRVAVVYRYGIEADGRFTLNKSMVWPMLRTIPNNTHASLQRRFNWNPLEAVTVNGFSLSGENVETVTLNGTLEVNSVFPRRNGNILLKRIFFSSTEYPTSIEKYVFVNQSDNAVSIEIPLINTIIDTNASQGVDGSYRIELKTTNGGSFILQPNDSLSFGASIAAYKNGQPTIEIDTEKEFAKRTTLVGEWLNNLVFESPNQTLNTMFAFSKIRACESIFETKGGPMHGPGGESYYAAIWANDQAEYINPYFPFIGYPYGNESAMNAFRHFARYMNDEWKPIPSSIIAEGDGYWNGAGDRGDAAMIAYGAARYALSQGNKAEAQQLWPLIKWCLEYCRLKMNAEGAVASDHDELEGRFPAGDANLSTSSLYYDALLSASYLAKELGEKPSVSKAYLKEAEQMAKNIDCYFASNVEGFDTYAYYKGNDILRSWICIPLTVGIFDQKVGTIEALFSPRLWTKNGLLTQAGSQTFWDRSTLYALRGVFMAGEVEKALTFFDYYSSTRLLGEHVPYAIEAWPEGSQRHLSAESALYGRIVTEGLFGIRPTGFRSFTLAPRLPKEWDKMSLRNIKAFDCDFDIEVYRHNSTSLDIQIVEKGKTVLKKRIKDGDSLSVKL